MIFTLPRKNTFAVVYKRLLVMHLLILLFLSGCSFHNTNDIFVSATLVPAFYPREKFTTYSSQGRVMFEYTQYYNEKELDFMFEGKNHMRVIQKIDSTHYAIKTLRTDSLKFPTDYSFKADSSGSLVITEIGEGTKWELLDSIVVPDVIFTVKRYLSDEEVDKLTRAIDEMKPYSGPGEICIDGLTTYLQYKDDGEMRSYVYNCNYGDFEDLNSLINVCFYFRGVVIVNVPDKYN
jgi:hypothetical protein